MKRALALLLTMLMVLSLFPATAFAEEASTPEDGVIASSDAPETTAEPSATPTAEVTPTEALPSESPSLDALFLNLLGCDSKDSDGVGHVKQTASGEKWSFTVKCETNGDVSYRWQTLDQTSTAQDPYVDINTSDNPTADEKTLVVPANEDALGVEDYYRCVVTATAGEETLTAYCCFTAEQGEAAPAQETPAPTTDPALPTDGAPDMFTMGTSYYATSMADIIYAIGAGKTDIICSGGSFSITQALTIPSNVSLTIMTNYVTVTIAAGVTLTNNGSITVDNMGYLDVSGTIKNAGEIVCYNGGTMTVYDGGSYQMTSSSASLVRYDYGQSGCSTIIGVSLDQIDYVFEDTTGFGFYAGFDYAQAAFRSKVVDLTKPVTIDGTNHATIPANTDVYAEDDLTITDSATLTNNGTLYVLEGATLTNNGTLENNGSMLVYGTVKGSGTFTGADYDQIANVNSYDTLDAAITAGATQIFIKASFSLTSSLTIPDGVSLDMNAYTITVPSGVTLINEGSISIPTGGKLLIKSTGKLINNKDIDVPGGSLVVESGGTYQSGSSGSLWVDVGKSGTATGISTSKIDIYTYATTDAMMRSVLTYSNKGYHSLEIDISGSISLASNMTIPSDVVVALNAIGGGTKLTVPTGKTLTNNGYIYVAQYNTLQINAGATLVNNGQIEVEINGELIKNGTISGSGVITYGDEEVSTWEALLAAVEANRANITLRGDVTLEDDLTIDAGTTLILDGVAAPQLTVPDGMTLTVNGALEQQGGTTTVQDGGQLLLNGGASIYDGTFAVDSGAVFENNGLMYLKGTASASFAEDSYTANAYAEFYYDDTDGANLSGLNPSFVHYICDTNDSATLTTALSKAADGYQFVEIYLEGEAELSDITIDASVDLSVRDGSTLTIAAGEPVVLEGTLNIFEGATLKIPSGATLTVADGGILNVEGTLDQDDGGKIEGEYTLGVANEAALRAALAAGVKMLVVTGSFSLTNNLTIPSDVTMTLSAATLTVPTGKILQIDGFLYLINGTLNVSSGGKLTNNCYISLSEKSRLTISTGAIYAPAADANLSFTYGVDTISGISSSLIDCIYLASTEAQLRTGLGLVSYHSAHVILSGKVTLTSSLSVPVSATLTLSEALSTELTIPSEKTLSINGAINVMTGTKLIVEANGTLTVNTTGSLNILGGQLVVNASGKVNYLGSAEVVYEVYTEAELEAAITAKATAVLICDDISLSASLTIPATMKVSILDGKTLTIPSGFTLTIEKTSLELLEGSLLVAGTLKLANGCEITIDDIGSLVIDAGGDIVFDGDEAMIYYTSTGSSLLAGIPDEDSGHVVARIFVTVPAALGDALTEFGLLPYSSKTVILHGLIAIDDDVTVPKGVQLLVESGATLTIPVGTTLTIEEGAELCVQNGGKLVLLGTIVNNGAITLSLDAKSGTGTIEGDSEVFAYSATAATLAQLKSAIASGKTPLTIEAGSFVISSSLTIPKDVEVIFPAGSTASIASGITLTNNGTLTLLGKFTNSGVLTNNNYFTVEESGVFTNNSALYNNADADIFGTMANNGTVSFKAGCRVRFHEGATKSGTRSTGSWYSIAGQAATGIEIVGPDYVSLEAVGAQQYIAQMLPDYAWPMDVRWSIKSGDDYATIDAETGELTALDTGDAVIRATAIVDGDEIPEIYGDKTVHVVTYAIDIQGETWMVAGKTLKLTGSFVPSNVTNTTIVWSLAEGDSAYASINSTSGLVTAKAITEEKTITVIARAADGSVDDSTHEITIYPALSGMQILWTDEEGTDVNVTGKTLSLNSYAEESLTFSCALIPTTAKKDITWTLSDETIAHMDKDEADGTVTITPIEGKSKLIVVTAKSTDGSGISASVWIQVSAVSSGITVTGPEDDVLFGGKEVQLVATFIGDQPTNKGVKWVLSPEYDSYATLSAKGLLTAKTVTQEVTIVVTVEPLDGGPSTDYEVTIKPFTSTLQLKRGDQYVTNTTQTVDLGHEPTVLLTAVVWPDTASQKIIFTTSDETIAKVDIDGTVTVLKTGTVIITAKADDGSGKLAYVKLNIVNLPQEIEAATPILELRGGASATYRVKDGETGAIIPASQVKWTLDSESSNIAKITAGGLLSTFAVTKPVSIQLKAEVIGNEEIATTTVDVMVYPATLSIQLFDDAEQFTGPVVFDTYYMPDGGGDSMTLTYKTIPGDAMPSVTWTSSNPTIATVEDGVITPVWNSAKGAYNTGVATITVKTKDGTNLSASTAVQVVSLAQSISLVTATGASELASGASIQLKATLGNAAATNPRVYYSILSGAQFASVSTGGLVTAKTVYHSEETIVVLARAADGSCEAQLTLTVVPKEEDPLVIQPLDGTKILNDTRESYDIKSGAAAVKLAANGSITGLPVVVKWSVSPSSIGRVSIVGGVPTLQSLTTGVVKVTATDAKGRTASFTAEFYKPATSLTIKAPKGMDVLALTLGSGRTMQLSGVIAPTSGVTTSGVNWFIATKSGEDTLYLKDTSLASISSTGLLTAKPGLTEQETVTVYAVTKNAPYLTASVNVTLTPAVTGLDIVLDSAVVNNLTVPWDISVKTIELTSVVYPGTANDTVTWTSSNKSIATIATDGTITVLKAGTVTITAKAEGVSASFKLALSVRATAIDITSKTGFDMRAGGTLQLGTAFTPAAPTDKRVTWKLLDGAEQYATISSAGLVTAKVITHQQKISVQVISVENETVLDEEVITIYPPTTKVQILADSVDVTGKTLLLDLNEMTSLTLQSLNMPSLDSGALQDVVWKSSNTSVLRVSTAGVLTPVKNTSTGRYYTGTVTVTATAADGSGKSASVKVFVGYLVQALTIADGLTVQAGKSLTLKPTFDPVYATNKALKWTIKASDTPYATISSTGVLTTKMLTEGRDITIYCEALDGSGTIAEITVSITV